MALPPRVDHRLSAAFGGGGAGLSLLELCMSLKRTTPWLLFKIKLIQNAPLAVEIEIFPTIVLNKKGKFLGCEASRATTTTSLEKLRVKTVGPEGMKPLDHHKNFFQLLSLYLIGS